MPHYTESLIYIAVGLFLVFRTDYMVVTIEKRMQISTAAKADVQWRNARAVFRIVGCVFLAAGLWQLLH